MKLPVDGVYGDPSSFRSRHVAIGQLVGSEDLMRSLVKMNLELY